VDFLVFGLSGWAEVSTGRCKDEGNHPNSFKSDQRIQREILYRNGKKQFLSGRD
jgi:hypothetical protein